MVIVISPHEGLWEFLSMTLVCRFEVISPHEGLWGSNAVSRNMALKKLFLPMRGYEGSPIAVKFASFSVISPHEGLWAGNRSLDSPCTGVISPHEGLWGWKSLYRLHPTGGYFSPWGVMRSTRNRLMSPVPVLFLPMRGYEIRDIRLCAAACPVISPHEGLWGIFPVMAFWALVCYFSPWGVMRWNSRTQR